MKKTFCLLTVFLAMTAVLAAQEVQIKEAKPFSYAYLDCQGSYQQIPQKIGLFMQEFFKQQLVPYGEFFGLYLNSPEQVPETELRWRVGFPVDAKAEVKAPLLKDEFPFTVMAVYLYVGPYEQAASCYAKIFGFIDQNGYRVAGPIMEKYLDQNPQAVEPAKLRTEIVVPVAKKP